MSGSPAGQGAPADEACPRLDTPGEILIAIGASDGGRPHARIGDRFQDMKEMGITQ